MQITEIERMPASTITMVAQTLTSICSVVKSLNTMLGIHLQTFSVYARVVDLYDLSTDLALGPVGVRLNQYRIAQHNNK